MVLAFKIDLLFRDIKGVFVALCRLMFSFGLGSCSLFSMICFLGNLNEFLVLVAIFLAYILM